MDTRIPEIRKHLKKKLDPLRYEHTLGVEFTCQALAMRYGYDLRKAGLAGLLHDCAKYFDDEMMVKKCQKYQIPITPSEYKDPSLLHAKLGAYLAKEKYQIADDDILTAIACHTTGKTDMSLLDKILYVADYIEPGRYKAEGLPEMRRLAFIDLDAACLTIMERIIQYLQKTADNIDEMTILAYENMRRTVCQSTKAQTADTPKEVNAVESIKRNGKNRSRRFRREKGRRH